MAIMAHPPFDGIYLGYSLGTKFDGNQLPCLVFVGGFKGPFDIIKQFLNKTQSIKMDETWDHTFYFECSGHMTRKTRHSHSIRWYDPMMLLFGCSTKKLPPQQAVKASKRTHLSSWFERVIGIKMNFGKQPQYSHIYTLYRSRDLDTIVFASSMYLLAVSPSGISRDLHDVKEFICTQLLQTIAQRVANAPIRQDNIRCTYNLGVGHAATVMTKQCTSKMGYGSNCMV